MKSTSQPNRFRTKKHPSRHGAAATEAAIVLPIMLTMALGAVDFGRVFGSSVELSNAVQAGAESGATNRPTTLGYSTWLSSVQTAVMNELNDSTDFNTNQVTVTVNLLTDAQGNQQVQVSASYPFQTIVNWPFLPNKVPLQAQMIMRQYR